jgi:hypothetical protein
VRGSLCLHGGVLYVGTHAKTAHVAAFDLDGRPIGPSFSFRDPDAPFSAASGLALDRDHRIWVADTPAGAVRALTLFGAEIARIGGDRERAALDLRGHPGEPVDVAPCELRGEECLAVASAGVRRHALQVFDPSRGALLSLRPGGDPQGVFQNLRGIASDGELLYACEAGARRVQVFRRFDFHFALRVSRAPSAVFEPTAIAPVGDGRVAIAVGGKDSALLLVDGSGRLLSVLAEGGADESRVFEPSDLALEPGAEDRRARLAVIDKDGERVQVFNLEGRCYGAFEAVRRSG